MKILKFGGKSLETREKIENICKFIKKLYATEKQIIVVVSAMGKTTDELLNLSKDFKGNSNSCDRELAKLLSTGETQCSTLVAMKLLNLGVPAKSFSSSEIEILTYGSFLDARISYINKSKLKNALDNNIVSVVAGFQGVNRDGETTVLGRGGSDTTAVALGVVFDENVEIFSDFDGIFSGDPKLDNFKKLKKINYSAVNFMAENGAKVLDSRACKIAKEFQTTIISKSSSRPELSGTIVGNIETDTISITAKQNLSKVTIVFSNKNRREKILTSVLKTLKNYEYFNLKLDYSTLEFFVNQKDLTLITSSISKSLKLLKEEK